jgi:iron complex outermembrane receptor protein
MNILRKNAYFAAGVGLGLCSATSAIAQVAPATSAEEASTAIDDIVVTARRRAESQQTVPVAITAINAEMLREKQILTPYDLTASTPGIAATTGSSSRNDVLYFVRGQGATFGSSPSVVTYFADVPQQTNSPTGGSNITFYDLESIQVLKGPQGTLFGRSTTAGAVLLTPRKPGNDFDGFVEISLGNYAAKDFTAALNVPIIEDRLAVRVAGNYSYHRGYAKSLTTGQDLDDRNRSSFRISLLAKPTDWLTNTLIFSEVNIDENGTAAILGNYEPDGLARMVVDPRLPGGSVITGSLLDTRPGGVLGLTTDDPAAAGGLGFISVNGLCNNSAIAALYTSTGKSVAQCISERIGLIDAVRASLDSEAARLAAGGSRRRLATTRDNFIKSRVQQIINTTDIDFGSVGFLGDVGFKNIFSATRNLQSIAVREMQGGVGSGVIFNDLQVSNPNCSPTLCVGPAAVRDFGGGKNDWGDVYSEEAQLSGRINDKHDWVVGFFTERSKSNQYLNLPAVFQVLNGAFTTPAGLPGISSGYNIPYSASQTGYFGQTTLDLGEFGLDGFRFTAGYRHSIVKQSLTAVNAVLTPAGVSPAPDDPAKTTDDPVPAALRQTANSYTFALDWQIAPNVLAYGTTRKGFKQGGINIQSVVAANNGIASAVPYFGPEKVTDYEVGLKADYSLGNVGARTNIAVFQADYQGLQRATSFFNGQATSNQIVNAAKLRTRGIELEQILRLTPEFTLTANYAYLDSKILSFPGVLVRPASGEVIERINMTVTGAPKHKLDVAARYAVDVGDAGEFVLSGNASYQSSTWISDDAMFSTNPRNELEPGYVVANLRADWNSVMGNPIDVSLFVRNVFNKLYRVGTGNLISSQLGTTNAIYSDPRLIGIQVRARFGKSADQ